MAPLSVHSCFFLLFPSPCWLEIACSFCRLVIILPVPEGWSIMIQGAWETILFLAISHHHARTRVGRARCLKDWCFASRIERIVAGGPWNSLVGESIAKECFQIICHLMSGKLFLLVSWLIDSQDKINAVIIRPRLAIPEFLSWVHTPFLPPWVIIIRPELIITTFAFSCKSTDKETRRNSFPGINGRWFEGIPLRCSPTKEFQGPPSDILSTLRAKWISSHQPSQHMACPTRVLAWCWLTAKNQIAPVLLKPQDFNLLAWVEW